MQMLYTDRTVSMSEFKKNPASVLRAAERRPVAVLNHNKPAFYMVEPQLFEALMEELADQETSQGAVAHCREGQRDRG